MRLKQLRPDETVNRAALVLLLLVVPSHLWAAGADLPFGGPNIWVGASAVAVAFLYVFISFRRSDDLKTFAEPYQPLIPEVVIGLLLLLWAVCVYIATETFLPRRVAQMGLGICVLFAVFCCVSSARRAHAVVIAIVLATVASTVFGFGVAFYGDPFLTIWLRLEDGVHLYAIKNCLALKRIAGLSSDPITFSYQLAVALPLAFSLLLYGWPGQAGLRRVFDATIGIFLVVMTTGMMANASRSLILGVTVGIVVISAIYLKAGRAIGRLIGVWCLVVGWLLIFFNPHLGVDRIFFPEEPRIAVADLSTLEGARRGSFEWKLARAYEALLLADGRLVANARLFRLMDSSTRPRPHMVTTAIRYALDYPLGTGRYYPSDAHVSPDLDDRTKFRILNSGPHNQFLMVLVYYGFPGLLLLIGFYLQMLRPLWPAFVRSLGKQASEPGYLVPGIIGGMGGYTVNSLLHNNGPFVGDWYHFVFVGLIFALPRVLGTTRPVDGNAR